MTDPVTAFHRRFYDAELRQREGRPLADDRLRRVTAFAARLRERGLRRVLEVGAGAARDGRILAEAGLGYVGVDLSRESARICARYGLRAVQASATQLPFADGAFDAAWTMSTLMHLPGDGLPRALAELRRVVAPGGLAAVGVWGAARTGVWRDEHGRTFHHRSDDDLRAALTSLGRLVEFEATPARDARYQWAIVQVASH